MEELSARVERVFKACLWTEDEVKEIGEERLVTLSLVGEGIVVDVGFNPYRLGWLASEIREMIQEMDPQFFPGTGDGWSFLALCHDRHGNQWTDLHQRMEQLVQLAIAAKMGRYCLPREMWHVLPGGMPYVVFNVEAAK